MTEKNRINWIDYSKVVLIILVVLGHSPLLPYELDLLICGFHMPAFFIISGYLHKCQPTITSCIIKNGRRLLIPAILFSLICYIYWLSSFLLNAPFSLEECVLKPLYGLFFYDVEVATPVCGVIWFLVVLFLCFFIIDFVVNNFRIIGIITISVCCILATIIFSYFEYKDFQYGFYVQRTVISFPYVALGFILRQRNIGITNNKKKCLVMAIVLTLAYVILVSHNGRGGIYSCNFGRSVILYYVVAIIGSLALFHWTGVLKKSSSMVIKLSMGTIVILCLHQSIIRLLCHIWVNPYFTTIVTIAFCYAIIPFLYRYLPWLVGLSTTIQKSNG